MSNIANCPEVDRLAVAKLRPILDVQAMLVFPESGHYKLVPNRIIASWTIPAILKSSTTANID